MFQFLTCCWTGARRKPTVCNKDAVPETGACEKRSDAIVAVYEPYLDEPPETVETIDPYRSPDPYASLFKGSKDFLLPVDPYASLFKGSKDFSLPVDPYAELGVRPKSTLSFVDPYARLGRVEDCDNIDRVDYGPYGDLFGFHRSDIDGAKHEYADSDGSCLRCSRQTEYVETVHKILQGNWGSRLRLQDEVFDLASDWEDDIAGPFRVALEKILQADHVPGGVLSEAYEQVMAEVSSMAEFADEFAHEKPSLTGALCTVVALGTMELIWPKLIDCLGFRLEGPIEDSWAALWQSTHGEKVPARSLFSLLQRLALTEKGL